MNTDISQVTPSNISFIVDRLDNGESLVISRRDDGTVVFSITKGTGTKQRETTHLDNCLFSVLNKEPVAPGWMGVHEEPSHKDTLIRREHRKLIHEKVKKSGSARDMMLACLSLELAFMDISEASLTKNHMTSYYVWKLGDYEVYTTPDKEVKMWKEGERGELVYV